MIVPNQFPERPAARRIAIIGEAPGAHEVAQGKPFVGPSGQLLSTFLAHAGIDREACFVGNVCQAQPPGNDITKFKWDGEEVQSGLKALADDLRRFQPHFILLLGGTALRAFKAERASIDDWRGSLFLSASDSPLPGVKCMATYHPARVLREWGLTGVCKFDYKRAADEARVDGLVVPEDYIRVDCTCEELLAELRGVKHNKMRVAVDIEGWVDFVSCIGFAPSHNAAFVVPFIRADGTSRWTEDEEVQLWQAVAEVLEDPAVPKVLQNSLYDAFVLAWSYGIVIEGIVDDTMLKHFELFCELEKSLGFQTSIYTKHPFYKWQRKSDDEALQLTYCGRDCCRTLECCDAQEKLLKPQQREHYRFNLSLLAPLLYMELRGIRYDKAEADRRLTATQQAIYELQDQINQEAARSASRVELHAFYAAFDGGQVEGVTAALLPLLTSAFCQARRVEKREVEEVRWQPMRWNGKKWVRNGCIRESITEICQTDATQIKDMDQTWFKEVRRTVTRTVPVAVETLEDVQRFALGSKSSECRRACHLLESRRRQNTTSTTGDGIPLTPLTPAQRGELATLLGIHVKVNATGEGGDAQWFLYEHCALPKQFQKDGNKLTTKLASDDEALIKAYLKSGKDDATRDKRAMLFLDMRRLITQTKTLKADCDADGRIRCGYNLVGTDTHRLSCYESPTGSGFNLQTVTKKHRDLFTADEGCWLGQRDLAGADGWTVAAYAAMLGDPTMLLDYRAKLKPAQILTLMQDRGASVNAMSRDDLRPLCKVITEETDWRYFANKRRQHGRSYMMGKITTSDQILTDSFKLTGRPIYVTPHDCEVFFHTCFDVRYPGVAQWHRWMENQLRAHGVLVASNGFQRRFFGRKDDASTVRAALAHLPQVYTTYATTLAIARLWSDPENRRGDGSLRVEPLHTVHDSLVPQWRKEDTDFAKAKLRAWFDNPMLIAQETITIPASGTYGPSWGEQAENL